jgi:hypothetical protein
MRRTFNFVSQRCDAILKNCFKHWYWLKMCHSVGYDYAVKKYDRGEADKIRRRLDRFSTVAVPQKFDAARRRNSTAPESS